MLRILIAMLALVLGAVPPNAEAGKFPKQVRVYQGDAPMQMHFFEHDTFGPAFRGAAFIAFVGGTNSNSLGHKVSALMVEPDGNSARPADFLTGIHRHNEDNRWARPVGVVSDRAGNLYVSSDDDTHVVLRIESDGSHGTAVEDEATDVPADFALGQNCPNPFNSTTTIRFALPAGGPVELDIYNLAGQRVARLVSGRLEAGEHALTWHARDAVGGAVATGVYLYRLFSGQLAQTRKLLFLQ